MPPLTPVSLLSWNLAFSRCSRATTAKKCTKKRDARAKLLFCQSKPIGLLPFSLPSPSSLLKLPNIRRKGHQIVLEELKQRVTAQAAKLRSSEENYTVMAQNKLFECNQKALLGARRNWKNQWYDTRCRRVKKFRGWNLTKRCKAQCRGRTVARSKEWAGWPGKERRGEDFCTDDQKTAKENALLEISVSSLYAGLLVEKVYTITWENCNSIKWVPIFEISTRMVNQGKNCISSKKQRKRWWRGKRQTYYMPATNVEASYRSVGRHNLNEHLERKSLLPEEQKECRRNLRGTKDQLLIDKMILKNCRRRKTGLGVVW